MARPARHQPKKPAYRIRRQSLKTKKPRSVSAKTSKPAARGRSQEPTAQLHSVTAARFRFFHWLGLGVVVVVLGLYAVSTQAVAMGEQALNQGMFQVARQRIAWAQTVFPLIPRQSQLQRVSMLEDSHQQYAAGLTAFHNQQWEQAAAAFSLVNRAAPQYLTAQTYLVNIHQLQQKSAASTAMLTEAKQFLADQDFVKAETLLQSITPQDEGYSVAVQLRQSLATAKEEQLATLPALPNQPQQHIPILMYHYISTPPNKNDAVRVDLSVTPQTFEGQMAYLVEHGFQTVTMNEVDAALKGHGTLPTKPVVLTFDDGYRDFYTNAFPILQKYHLKAMIYVVADFASNPAYLNWEMIKTMVDSGLVTVGSHTLDHADLPYKSSKTVVRELTESKKILEQQLGRSVTSFCYPYGGFTEEIAREVQQAGYLDATTTLPGSWHSADDLFTLTRVRVKNSGMKGYVGEGF